MFTLFLVVLSTPEEQNPIVSEFQNIAMLQSDSRSKEETPVRTNAPMSEKFAQEIALLKYAPEINDILLKSSINEYKNEVAENKKIASKIPESTIYECVC